jgi:DNA-directed RNA polymerase specialized sigma24 family protein
MRRDIHLDTADDKKIRRLYEVERLTTHVIAQRFDMSQGGIQNALKRTRPDPPPKPKAKP